MDCIIYSFLLFLIYYCKCLKESMNFAWRQICVEPIVNNIYVTVICIMSSHNVYFTAK